MAAKPKKKAKSSVKKVAKKKASSKVASKAKPAAKSARAKAKPAAKAAKPRAAAPKAAAPPYHTVTAVLNIDGADSAIDFFKQAFGAKERGGRMAGPDGKIMHAEIVIGDSVVMVSDVVNQTATKSSLHIYVPDCDSLYSQALAAGATAKMPLQDMFWGDRFGSVSDPFGNTWSVATHKEDVSPAEMEKRMAAMGPPPGLPPAAA